jgi:hypothetical protein
VTNDVAVERRGLRASRARVGQPASVAIQAHGGVEDPEFVGCLLWRESGEALGPGRPGASQLQLDTLSGDRRQLVQQSSCGTRPLAEEVVKGLLEAREQCLRAGDCQLGHPVVVKEGVPQVG